MDRRLFLREAILLVGGTAALATLPGCSWQDAPANISRGAQQRLTKIIDIMLPKTGTFGALEVDAPEFVGKILANWASAETRTKLLTVLDRPELVALYGMGRTEASAALSKFDTAAFAAKDKNWGQLKQLSMLGYFGSEKYRTEIEKFELVPGRYDPCANIEEQIA